MQYTVYEEKWCMGCAETTSIVMTGSLAKAWTYVRDLLTHAHNQDSSSHIDPSDFEYASASEIGAHVPHPLLYVFSECPERIMENSFVRVAIAGEKVFLVKGVSAHTREPCAARHYMRGSWP
jgi:hypothetical protein